MGRYVNHGEWSGQLVREARLYIGARLPMPCLQCGEMVQPGQSFRVGHIVPRWKAPELAAQPSNWAAEHTACSQSTARAEQQAAMEAREAARPSWEKRRIAARKAATASVLGGPPPREPPLLSGDLSLDDERSLPPATKWPDVIDETPWLATFRVIPSDSIPPRFMTAPHPLAVGTYGPEFLAWADANPSLHPKRTGGFRWFQRLLAYRVLEHDAEGRLLWRNVLITMARQCGKSWFIRALITWRIQQRDLFGEEDQTVIHVANRLVAAQEIWRPARFWAKGREDWAVRIANGEQELESPEHGRWMIRAAADGVGTSFSLSMLLVDEAWQVRRDVVETADAALTEAESPQLVLISTAGDSQSDLFGTYRMVALDELTAPDNHLIVEWSAPRSLPIEAVSTWRLASPFWSERREREVADKFKKMELGEFRQQFTNAWQPVVRKVKEDPARPAFTEAELEAINGTAPGEPTVAAVEDWFGQGLSVAFADLSPDGQARVTVQLAETAEEAAAIVRGHEKLQQIVVGKTLLTDPAFQNKFRMTGVVMNSRDMVAEMRRLLKDDALRHDGSEALIEQALAATIVEGPSGPRVRSDGRLDAVKATVFAAKAVRALPPVGQIF